MKLKLMSMYLIGVSLHASHLVCDSEDLPDRIRVRNNGLTMDILKPNTPGLNFTCDGFWHEFRFLEGSPLEVIFYVPNPNGLVGYIEPTDISMCNSSTVVGPLMVSPDSAMADDSGIINNIPPLMVDLLINQTASMGGSFIGVGNSMCGAPFFFLDARFIEEPTGPVNIRVTKTLIQASPQSFFIGQPILFEVRVENLSNFTANNLRMNDQFPPDIDIQDVSFFPNLPNFSSGNDLFIDLPPIPANSSISVFILATSMNSGMSSNFCTVIDSADVIVDDAMGHQGYSVRTESISNCSMSINTAPTVFCSELFNPFQMNLQVSGGVAPYTFLWTPPADVVSPFQQNPIFSSDQSQIYTVVVTDSVGCQNSFHIPVFVLSLTELVENWGRPTAVGEAAGVPSGILNVQDILEIVNRCLTQTP